jgi:hypothetical protein
MAPLAKEKNKDGSKFGGLTPKQERCLVSPMNNLNMNYALRELAISYINLLFKNYLD